MDLQTGGTLRSLYTGHEWDPEQLIRADLAIVEARSQQLTARLQAPAVPDADAVLAEVEAELPFNCEHVVPQSWFAKQEPMRGDLHHLFACECRCNGFRANTPFAEFADFPASAALGSPLAVVRSECGKSEGDRFEPARGKGPAARAVLYFLLRYPGVVRGTSAEQQQLMVSWHEQDPVTEWELHRNAAIFARQGNRNPFIDRPELARELFLRGGGGPMRSEGAGQGSRLR